MTPCQRSRRRATAWSSSLDQSLSPHGDLWPEQGSGSLRDPAPPPDPAGHTPGGPLPATHAARAAARWSAPAARDGTTWASACPILTTRSIAVTAIWADLRASVERLGAIYAQQAPSPAACEQPGSIKQMNADIDPNTRRVQARNATARPDQSPCAEVTYKPLQ
jgi:hypothetical protein